MSLPSLLTLFPLWGRKGGEIKEVQSGRGERRETVRREMETVRGEGRRDGEEGDSEKRWRGGRQ
jgi:hypothetical protein